MQPLFNLQQFHSNALDFMTEVSNTDRSVCFVSTIAWPLRIYIGPHIRKISEGNHVTLVADGVSDLSDAFDPTIERKQVAIRRKINLIYDALALYKLWRIFRINQYCCVHSIMPKAGFLAMLAAALAKIPIRFHTFTGQVWVTKTGFARRFLIFMDWLTATLATKVLTDSLSQRDFLVANRIVKAEKIEVLGIGSIAGVDTARFAPNDKAREKIRTELGIGRDDIVFVFIGRLNRDKGVTDLLAAFREVMGYIPNAHLLLVGPDEEDYDIYIEREGKALLGAVHRVGFTLTPEVYLAAADIFCLPSYREGFNNVILESGSVCVPAVASRIYGITDPVVDGVTGILHEPGNVQEIVRGMVELAQNSDLRAQLGASARARVIAEFSEKHLTDAFQQFYRKNGVLTL